VIHYQLLGGEGELNPCFDDVRLRVSADVLLERIREQAERRGLLRMAVDVITFVMSSSATEERQCCEQPAFWPVLGWSGCVW
jgi:hypothetical protein